MIRVSKTIDHCGLNPYEFRVYSHITRRVICFANLDTISAVCRISRRKIQTCLKDLELRRFSSKKRNGFNKPKSYRISPKEGWLNSDGKQYTGLVDELKDLPEPYRIIYINGQFDLYGLDVYSFRVFAHFVACNGFCKCPIKKIGETCKIGDRKVHDCIKNLIKMKLIRKSQNPGRESLYMLNPVSRWAPSEYKDPIVMGELTKVQQAIMQQQAEESSSDAE